MSSMQSTGSLSAAKAVKESDKMEAQKTDTPVSRPKENVYSPGAYGPPAGAPRKAMQNPRERPTVNSDYVPPERTSSASFKAPATTNKKKSAPLEEPSGSPTLSLAFEYISAPVKYIASKFTSQPPEPPAKTKKSKVEFVPKRTRNATKPASNPKPVESPVIENVKPKDNIPVVEEAKDTKETQTSVTTDQDLIKKSFTPKSASRSYVPPIGPTRTVSPAAWKPPEKKDKRPKTPPMVASNDKLMSANSVNIAPSNKLSYKVTSKNKVDAPVKKKDPRKIYKYSYNKTQSPVVQSKSPTLTSGKTNIRRDLTASPVSDRSEELSLPTFVRQSLPPSYTVKTVSSDIPDRSNSASTEAIVPEVPVSLGSPSKPQLMSNKLKTSSLPITSRTFSLKSFDYDSEFNFSTLEDTLLSVLGPTFLGPTELTGGEISVSPAPTLQARKIPPADPEAQKKIRAGVVEGLKRSRTDLSVKRKSSRTKLAELATVKRPTSPPRARAVSPFSKLAQSKKTAAASMGSSPANRSPSPKHTRQATPTNVLPPNFVTRSPPKPSAMKKNNSFAFEGRASPKRGASLDKQGGNLRSTATTAAGVAATAAAATTVVVGDLGSPSKLKPSEPPAASPTHPTIDSPMHDETTSPKRYSKLSSSMKSMSPIRNAEKEKNLSPTREQPEMRPNDVTAASPALPSLPDDTTLSAKEEAQVALPVNPSQQNMEAPAAKVEHDDPLNNYSGHPYRFASAATMLGELP